MFSNLAPCTNLHEDEQKVRTKILAEFPDHVSIYGGLCLCTMSMFMFMFMYMSMHMPIPMSMPTDIYVMSIYYVLCLLTRTWPNLWEKPCLCLYMFIRKACVILPKAH